MNRVWTAADAARFVHAPTEFDDKYSRGVVGLHTGSSSYPGAAVLGVQGAWRAGVGMVRYLGCARDLVLARRPETVTVAGGVDAWVIGSGLDLGRDGAPNLLRDRSAALVDGRAPLADESALLHEILAGSAPVVVDAGALPLALGATAPVVVTPHAREYRRLCQQLGLQECEGMPHGGHVQETAAALDATVLLKGAETIIAQPDGWLVSVTAGTPWLATAGTGDVLAGVIGAVIAGSIAHARTSHAVSTHGIHSPDPIGQMGALAATGAYLHARAATHASYDVAPSVASSANASRAVTGAPITALDVADALPWAVAEALAETSCEDQPGSRVPLRRGGRRG